MMAFFAAAMLLSTLAGCVEQSRKETGLINPNADTSPHNGMESDRDSRRR